MCLLFLALFTIGAFKTSGGWHYFWLSLDLILGAILIGMWHPLELSTVLRIRWHTHAGRILILKPWLIKSLEESASRTQLTYWDWKQWLADYFHVLQSIIAIHDELAKLPYEDPERTRVLGEINRQLDVITLKIKFVLDEQVAGKKAFATANIELHRQNLNLRLDGL